MATAERTVRAGDVVLVGRAASVQFAGPAGFAFRVVDVDLRPTYEGWVWLDGYQLDRRGRPVLRRRIFVREAGLRRPPPKQP
ncbi:hypothetical protein [Actinoplanes sp. RD1]|uniref:hypothetical protein n=1 Tax=Actinoplanes sp. RD1 TaxID=3064538 RepID=UPI002741529D|nr:hypothetical protein [Actinoplanes sp. RD1]